MRLLFIPYSLFLLGTFAFLALASPYAYATSPKQFVINSFALKTENNMVSLVLDISVDNEDGLHDILKDGATVELGIELSVDRKRSWWSNANIVTVEYTSLLQHDPLSREFYLTTPVTKEQLKDRSLIRLLAKNWHTLQLFVIPTQLLALEGNDQTYIITANFSLEYKEIPPWLASNGLFWSSEVVPPASFTLEYKY